MRCLVLFTDPLIDRSKVMVLGMVRPTKGMLPPSGVRRPTPLVVDPYLAFKEGRRTDDFAR